MDKVILHIDFDSFFASVEQQDNPLLRNKPVGVTAANGRTCIIASSREAKKLGIKTGTRSWEAYKLCPSLILVKADFVKYFEISKKFLNICKDYSPLVELFSIDEVFMDATSTLHLFGGTYGIIEKIKKRIRKEIGEFITVSVGISHNKMLAKLASGLKKPNGVFEIKKEDINEVYKDAKLTDVCGIGERIKLRLNEIGIYNLLQLRDAPIIILQKEFGEAYSHILKNIGMGIDDSPVNPYANPVDVKSVGRNYCLPQNEYDKKIIMQNIYELCEEVGIKLRRLNKKARTIGIYLRGSENFHRQKTFQFYFNKGSDIFRLCLSRSVLSTRTDLDNRLGGNGIYVRQIGVWVGNLKKSEDVPLSLFDVNNKKEKVQKVIDRINERFGDHAIRNGFLLYADKLTTVPNGYMADRYERAKLAAENI
ncbi:MAG: DNA polymerase IV [Candidatus Levybacteria bacterium]|nr:DNA polymerase IV [Candidatus Levybacteria bacterium]